MLATLSSIGPCSAPDAMGVRRESMLVFADDWGRHPSSCQHLIRRLLDRHDVYWVNTIGTRTPRLDWATVRRGLEKVRQWLRPSTPTAVSPKNLQVLNPRMWPWCGSAFGRRLNRKLLIRQLTPIIEAFPRPPVAVTTIPIVADLMDDLPVRRWVYYCVDDFGQWPGLDQATMRQFESKLVQRADAIVAVSEDLQESLGRQGRTSQLLTHGVDLDFWTTPRNEVQMPALNDVQRPLVVFWGVVDRRMDLTFVERLAQALPKGSIVFAGPSNDPDPGLDRIARVTGLGPLPFEQLPTLAQSADVLIMPYADLPVTRAMQPLKLKEYLATGRPVVVRELPSTRPWNDCLDVAGTADAFVRAVCERLETGLPARQQAARRRLTEESWEAKACAFERWVFEAEAQPVDA